jgi:hypothetical protein
MDVDQTACIDDDSVQEVGPGVMPLSQRTVFQTKARSTTASTLIFSDMCDQHGDRLIAYDMKTGEIICNRCVYSRAQAQVQFTSTIARKTSHSSKEKFR